MIPLLLFAAGLAATTPPPAASKPATAPAPEVIKPPESLVVDGAPPIPAELVAAVRPYTEYRGASFFSFHPEQREMLIGTRFADTVQIHRVVAAGGARTQLTFFPDRVSSAAYPRAPLGEHPFFVFAKDIGGSEFWQIYRFDLETSAVTLLTDGRSRNTLGAFSHHGHRLAYTSTRRNGADNDIYVVDPADPKSDRRVAEVKGGGWEVVDWSPTDDRLLVSEEISINESYYWSFDVATGQRTALTPRPKRKLPARRFRTARRAGPPTGARCSWPPIATTSSSAWRAWSWRPESTPTSAITSTGTSRRSTSPTTDAIWPSWSTRTASGACTCSTRARARRGARPRCRPARSPASPGTTTGTRWR